VGIEFPAALAALLAVAVPLVLQRGARPASRVVPFPNVELLLDAGRRSRRQKALADAGLLAARAGAVALAALALSAPYFGERPPERRVISEGTVVVLVRRSAAWSTDADPGTPGGMIRDILGMVRPPGRALVVPFDDVPGPVIEGQEAMPDGRQALAVHSARPEAERASDVASALALASKLLETEAAAGVPATVVLIAPQETLREARELVTSKRLAEGVRFIPVDGDSPPRHRFEIVSAELESERVPVGSAFRVRARIRDLLPGPGARPPGESVRPGLELCLFMLDDMFDPIGATSLGPWRLDGSLETKELSIEATRRSPLQRLVRVEVCRRDGGTCAPQSGTRWIVLPRCERRHCVVVLTPGPAAGIAHRALGALEAAGASSRAVMPLEVSAVALDGLAEGALEAFDTVVVPDVGAIPQPVWDVLRDFVAIRGGSVLAFAGEARRDTNMYLFGAEPPGKRVAARTTLLPAPRTEPWLSPAAVRAVEEARLASYITLSVGEADVLLRFQTGDPAFVRSRDGWGRASLFAAGLEDLAQRPSVLVPLLDALLRATPLGQEPAVVEARGTPVVTALGPADEVAGARLVSRGGRQTAVDVTRAEGSAGAREATAWAVLPCSSPGLWQLEVDPARDAGTGWRSEALVAVNGPQYRGGMPEERDPVGVSPATLAGMLAGRGATSLTPAIAALAIAALAIEALAAMSAERRARSTRGPSDGKRGRA